MFPQDRAQHQTGESADHAQPEEGGSLKFMDGTVTSAAMWGQCVSLTVMHKERKRKSITHIVGPEVQL